MQLDYSPYKWVIHQIKHTSLTYFIQTYEEANTDAQRDDPQRDVSMIDANEIEQRSDCLDAWIKLMNTFKQKI